MTLTAFITELLEHGSVTLSGQLEAFSGQDTESALAALKQFHATDRLSMPYQAPDFQADAAVWAAQYLYRAMQLTLLREIQAEKIPQYLPTFDGPNSAETIYTADLMLRYLPDTLNLAKGLSPDDVLVVHLKKTAAQWPFSSVGISLDEPPDVAAILAHPSLQQAYIDRIIHKKDILRARQPAVYSAIQATLGTHTASFWADFEWIMGSQEHLPDGH